MSIRRIKHSCRLVEDIRVVLDKMPTFVPVIEIEPGTPIDTGAAKITMHLRAGRTESGAVDLKPRWIGEQGRGLYAVKLAAGEAAILAVEGNALREALVKGLSDGGGTIRPGTCLVKLEVRQSFNAVRPGEWRELSIEVQGLAKPGKPKGKMALTEIDLDQSTPNQPLAIGTIEIDFPPEVAFSLPNELEFELSLATTSGVNFMPVAVSLQKEAAGLIESLDFDSESAERSRWYFRITNPWRLAKARRIGFALSANPAQIIENLKSTRDDGHFDYREIPLLAELNWSGNSAGAEGIWVLAGAKTTLVAKSDRREWVRFSVAGNVGRRVIGEGGASMSFPPVLIELPYRPASMLLLTLDEIDLAFSTNCEIGYEFLTFRLEIANWAEDRIYSDTFIAIPVRQGGDAGESWRIVHGARFSLADFAGAEMAIRDYLASELQSKSFILPLKCRVAPDSAGKAGDFPSVDWLIEFPRDKPNWPICIDVGMSATSIWVGKPADPGDDNTLRTEIMLSLDIGEMHRPIDQNHDELPERNSSAVPGGENASHLIPSHIGLDSAFSLRGKYHQMSLGNLDQAGSEAPSVIARMNALGRSYDISTPFPSTAHLYDNADTVVFDLKRRITMNQRTLKLGRPVYHLPKGSQTLTRTQRIDTVLLLTDYLDELLRLYVSQFVRVHLEIMDPDVLSALANPRLILTHPIGIGEEQRSIYLDAARPVLRRLAGRFSAHNSGEDAASQRGPEPILVPEPVAAARYAISVMEAEARGAAELRTDENSLLISIDIGAGTFDVAILELRSRRSATPVYRVLQNFGVPIAGERLDQSITMRLAAILCELFSRREVADQFGQLDPGCDKVLSAGGGASQEAMRAHFWLRRQVRRGKSQLSRRIYARRDKSARYQWFANGPRFELLLWEQGEIASIVELASRLRGTGSGIERSFPVNGIDAVLRYEPFPASRETGAEEAEIAPARMWLSLGSEAFDGRKWDREGRFPSHEAVIEGLGRALTEIAVETAKTIHPGITGKVVISGRTSLWPPLFSQMLDTVAKLGGQMRNYCPFPFRVEEMKRAVVEGASIIVREQMERNLKSVYSNPLAIVEIIDSSLSADNAQLVQTERVARVHYLTKTRSPVSPANPLRGPVGAPHGIHSLSLVLHGRFLLARAIPGLDVEGRIDAINTILGEGVIIMPLRSFTNRGAGRGEGIRYTVKVEQSGRDCTEITLTDENSGRILVLNVVEDSVSVATVRPVLEKE